MFVEVGTTHTNMVVLCTNDTKEADPIKKLGYLMVKVLIFLEVNFRSLDFH